ncbi:ribosomal protein S5 domain 2-type protein [Ochromonadaceae sp. CCMP2298]|nr:ribosomal protein S5 domain 2-type protein [Ochromonadaceae sp. CCMP2298]
MKCCSYPPLHEHNDGHSTQKQLLDQPASHPIIVLGSLSRTSVTGSAYLEWNGSKVMCTVLGPKQAAKQSSLSSTAFDKAVIECEVIFAKHVNDDDVAQVYPKFRRAPIEKRLSHVLREAVESVVSTDYYPKQVIQIRVVVLQSSVYDLAAVVNCASSALADSSVRLLDILSSCSMFFSRREPAAEISCRTSPTAADTSSADFIHINVSALSSLHSIAHLYMEGRLGGHLFSAAQERLLEECKKVRMLIAQALKSKAATASTA